METSANVSERLSRIVLREVKLLLRINPDRVHLIQVPLSEGNTKMVTAIVLITIERGRVDDVAQKLLSYSGVSEVFSVAGRFDAVAILRTQTNEEIAELVTSHIRSVQYITGTETLMAFKAYSREDLSAMFSIGGDEK
jgi:DNA-binding Lrp family transcriptional regulator